MKTFNYDTIFYDALRIRLVEERVAQIYPSDLIQSPVHLSLGQEHHVAALCAALDPSDALFSSYRCHAAYLAKGGSLQKFFAELFGKKTGISKGKGGSMHLSYPEKHMYGSSGIVSAVIPHAVGFAYGLRLEKSPHICVSITGDGSLEEGVFYESLNFAKLRNAPVLFVIEQNNWAVYTKRPTRQSFSLAKIAAAYDIPFKFIEDNFNFAEVYDRVLELREFCLNHGPAILEIHCHRYNEHVGVRATDDFEEVQKNALAKKRDPLELDRDPLLVEKINKEIEAAVSFAMLSPAPEINDLLSDV